jgi:hypothetical protein
MERHLAAFESALELEARARLRTLVPASGLRTLTGAMAATDALFVFFRALGGLQIAQIHDVIPAP